MTSSLFDTIVSDLVAEADDLEQLLAAHPADDFMQLTPAAGWDVKDQIIHLGLFDRRCAWSISDPDKFIADRAGLAARGGVDAIHAQERTLDLDALLTWWRDGRDELRAAAVTADPRARCEWYGPSMSVTSMLTARIMETWAHGQDIADAWSVTRLPTDRLFHVAHIAVRARPFAYSINRRAMPADEIRVELTAPSGTVWTWGPENGHEDPHSAQIVRGSALGFCLAATQRRHVHDCGLEIVGDHAREWMSIVQAFAGAPGSGRHEGQFDSL